jgi:hypothetical protein
VNPNPDTSNLKPFKKGQSGNPKGRRKKLPELDVLLADVLGDEKDGLTAAEAILKKLRQLAISGNLRAAEILLDRAYGKAKQKIEHTGEDGAPIQVEGKTGYWFYDNAALLHEQNKADVPPDSETT